eukprot:jgi/Tetstr1/434534/TSEL_023625.t1
MPRSNERLPGLEVLQADTAPETGHPDEASRTHSHDDDGPDEDGGAGDRWASLATRSVPGIATALRTSAASRAVCRAWTVPACPRGVVADSAPCAGWTARLPALRRLVLSVAASDRLVEDAAAGLSALTALDLRRCESLSSRGLVALGDVASLTALELHGCSRELAASGLPELSELRRLSALSLRRCDGVSDASLAHLHRLPLLTSLSLGRCTLLSDAGLLILAALPALVSLTLVRCSAVSEPGLDGLLRRCTGLSSLTLAYLTHLGPGALAGLHRLTNLHTLALQGCDCVRDETLADVRLLTRLTDLNIETSVHVTEVGVAHLDQLPRLASLNLSDCSALRALPPSDLEAEGITPSPWANVTSLSVANCIGINRSRWGGLRYFSSLRSLDVKGCPHATVAVYVLADRSYLRSLTSLSYAYASHSHMDTLLRGLRHLTSLTSLDLTGLSSCTHTAVSHLTGITGLTALSLAGWRLTPELVAHLSELRALSVLKLARCSELTDARLAQLRVAVPGLTHVDLGRYCEGLSDGGRTQLAGLRQGPLFQNDSWISMD